VVEKSEMEVLLEFLAQYVLKQFWGKVAELAEYKARFHEKRGLEMLRLLGLMEEEERGEE